MTGWAERGTKLRGKGGREGEGRGCPMTGWPERDTKLRGKNKRWRTSGSARTTEEQGLSDGQLPTEDQVD